ncbi:hypothetical protein GCM10010390_40680 [Streptomyces mordarskii]|uniref:Uncharacterized protein n=1 Tax=Streptomyces mordarskii TaxID=1226758 RepID=A0ABN1D6E0_9ACTN
MPSRALTADRRVGRGEGPWRLPLPEPEADAGQRAVAGRTCRLGGGGFRGPGGVWGYPSGKRLMD